MQKLEGLTLEFNAMYRERMEYEERERKLAEERKQAGIKRVSGFPELSELLAFLPPPRH